MTSAMLINSSPNFSRSRWLNHPLTRIAQAVGFEPHGVNYFVELLAPRRSLTKLRACVDHIIDETHDTKTFVLRPNGRWKGALAGQHVGIVVSIDGVMHRRRYSLSSAQVPNGAQASTLQITVKRVPGGLVSNYLHDHAALGDVVELEPVAGDFVLADEISDRLLILTAGSGITPVYSQVTTLLASGYQGDIQFVHYVRSPSDRIFGERLEQLCQQHHNLSVQWCYENAANQAQPERFSAQQIQARVPDYDSRQVLLCGPGGFMAVVRAHWDTLDKASQLSFEYFGAPAVDAKDAVDADISLANGKQISLTAGETLLDALLANGETPKYGCKRGVCHECKCRKTSGAVKNLLTGKVSGNGEEDIQLCISTPVSNISLAQ